MILARTSILVIATLVGCLFAFFAAGIVALLQSIRLSNQGCKYWGKKGVKVAFTWWRPSLHLIDDPEYNKVRKNVNKVNLICVIIMFLSVAITFLIAKFVIKG